jgi:hypothetical protein
LIVEEGASTAVEYICPENEGLPRGAETDEFSTRDHVR